MTRNEIAAGAAAAARRATGRGIVIVSALAVLGVAACSPFTRPTTQESAVRQGVSAFDAGAFGLALKELQPPAKAGNPEAAFWLGRMYEDGLGVKRDGDIAVNWYRQSAEAGWVDAKLRLGEIYFRGTEELQDFKKAYKWLQQAANDGSPLAQKDLGTLYANGWGVKTSNIYAYVWYEFAAEQGDYQARRDRDRLLKTMPDDQVAAAQTLTRKLASELFTHSQNSSPAQASGNTDGDKPPA